MYMTKTQLLARNVKSKEKIIRYDNVTAVRQKKVEKAYETWASYYGDTRCVASLLQLQRIITKKICDILLDFTSIVLKGIRTLFYLRSILRQN